MSQPPLRIKPLTFQKAARRLLHAYASKTLSTGRAFVHWLGLWRICPGPYQND
jgi:hypothetical protein